MSVEVTTLKSGLNFVTDAMPHLETASLGVWVASGSRDERHDEHGISHFLEHMAFKARAGATRGRSLKKSRPWAAISTPRPALKAPPTTLACSNPTCLWRSTCSPISCPTHPLIAKSCCGNRM